MKKILSLAVCALFATAAMAQSKAEQKMSEGKYTEALGFIEADIQKVTNDRKAAEEKAQAKGKPFDPSKFNAKFADLYCQAGRCHMQIFNPELMNAANNMPLDTALFCSSLDKSVDCYTQSYVYDHTPNAKGKVSAKHDAETVGSIQSCLDYFFYAGIFMNENGNKEGATHYFKKHIELPSNPALAAQKDSILRAKADNYAQTAYYGCILNYEQKKWGDLLATVDAGLDNKEFNHDLYLMKAEAIMATSGDSTVYEQVLQEAVRKVDNNQDFARTLIAIYSERNDSKNALALADELVAKDPNGKGPQYIKGCVYLNVMEEFAAARECFGKALAIDPEDVDANFNMAVTFMNEVADMMEKGEFKLLNKKSVTGQKNIDAYKKEIETVHYYYESAKPYMEKVRELTPANSKKWASPLQRIYSNLGMQEEADEMDEIMRTNH